MAKDGRSTPDSPARPFLASGLNAGVDERELVVGTALYGDILLVLPRAVAVEQEKLYAALGSRTWGELRQNSTAEVYREVLGHAGYGSVEEFMSHLDVGRPVPGAEMEALRAYAEKEGEPLPDDDEPFDPDSLSAYADGDFPPAPQLIMYECLPAEVIERYGNVYETNFNGTFVDFPADKKDEIVVALEEEGYGCTTDQDLINSLQRS